MISSLSRQTKHNLKLKIKKDEFHIVSNPVSRHVEPTEKVMTTSYRAVALNCGKK